jgi:hypothetical protein
VAKVDEDRLVRDSNKQAIGRLIKGNAKKLYGKSIDANGDILDTNGNAIGRIERYEEEEKEKRHNPLTGRVINKEGNVVDENGDVVAKLTGGEATNCKGKEIDEDGNFLKSKGQFLGHITAPKDIPDPDPGSEEEPKETEEEVKATK